MARKKAQVESIEGLPGIDRLVVQKSRPLQALWQSDLTLPQFKILDVYLSRIDSHKPEKRLVRFDKGEIEKLLGVDRIRKEELDKRLDGLYRGIRVDDPNLQAFRKVGLFELAECTKGSDGLWTVDLQCSSSAMKYIFDIEHLGYLRYKLRSIVSLRSRYAYVLFVYIESQRYRKMWEVGLDELRTMLGATDPTYSSYKYFRQKVLDKAQEELISKTEMRFTYTPVKRGRMVVAIRFEVETLRDLDPVEDPDQITIEQWTELQTGDKEMWMEAVKPLALTTDQIEELRTALICVPDTKLPADDNLDVRRYKYMTMAVAELTRRSNDKRIKDKYKYLLKMIKNGTKGEGEATQAKSNGFHNFEQREYDYDALMQSIRNKN